MIPPHYRKHGETAPTTGLLQHDALVKYLNLSDDVDSTPGSFLKSSPLSKVTI